MKTVLIAILLLTTTAAVRGMDITTVTLRSTVRLDANAECTLGAIAEISGAQAPELTTIVIEPTIQSGQWTRIDAETIREILDASQRIRAGSIVVAGNELFVTRRPQSIAHALAEPQPEPTTNASSVPTLADHLNRHLAKRFGADPKNIRVHLRDADRALLARQAEGRLIEISQIGSSTNRLSLRITLYQGERIEDSFTVQAQVEIRRAVMIATEDIARDTLLTESIYSLQIQWFSTSDTPAKVPTNTALSARTRLRAGTLIMSDDVQSPTVIKRGDIISARSIAGSVVVNLRARALGNARDGELFELESFDRTSRFTARASGAGRAVIIQDTTP